MDPVHVGWTVLAAAAESGAIEETLVDLLPVFILAAGVGIFVSKVGRFPYTIALLIAGLAISVLGAVLGGGEPLVDIHLTHDLIFLVLLPPLLFEGAATTDLERLRRNLGPVLALAAVGLPIAIVLLGIVGASVFDFGGGAPATMVALLFAATVLPTDPVSVLALFEELGAPERLAVLVEGESLVNDGVGVVIFTTFLVFVEEGVAVSTLLEPSELATVGVELVVASVGGLLVGAVTGYAVYSVMRGLDDHMTEIVLTFILAYGSFLLAEELLSDALGVPISGVIATVVAGLFIGNRGAEYAMSPRTKVSIFSSLDTAAFLVNTFIFIMIGVDTPVGELVDNAGAILLAIPLVLLARAAVVYPISELLNLFHEPRLSREYQHVLVWGGLHGSIPIALALGLEGAAIPGELATTLKAMVFGVAAFSLVVQGLTMGRLLNRLGIATQSETDQLHELLLGRARAVDAALEAADQLYEEGDITTSVYEEFTAEYEREKAALEAVLAQLVSEHPELREQRLRAGEERLLDEEKGAIMDAMRRGRVGHEVGEELLREVDVKIDRVHGGESTVARDHEEYQEFWRDRAAEAGLDVGQNPESVGSDEDGPTE